MAIKYAQVWLVRVRQNRNSSRVEQNSQNYGDSYTPIFVPEKNY